MECVFCDNIENKIIESNNFYIKVGKSIISEGHVMIVSKSHIKAMGAINSELADEFTRLKDKLKSFMEKNYYKPLIVENGAIMQSVFHAHVHFVPRKSNNYNEVSFLKDVVDNIPIKEDKEYSIIKDMSELLEIYKTDGEYLYFEEDNRKIVIRTKNILKSYFENSIKEELNYRRYFVNLTNNKSLMSWKNMTENDIKEDNEKIEKTKEKFKNNW